MKRLGLGFVGLFAVLTLICAPAIASAQAVTPLTRASTGDLAVQDTTGMDYAALQLTGTWVGTVVMEAADDNVNFVALTCITPAGAAVTSTTAVGAWVCPALHRYIRIRVSAYTSGTIVGNLIYAKGAFQGPVNVNVAGAATVAGGAAHSAAASGNPVQVACVTRTAPDTTLVANDTTALPCSASNALITVPYADGVSYFSYAALTGGIVNSTTAVTLKTAGAASVRNYLTACTVATDTLGAATELAIRDGAAGTVLYRTKLQTAALPTTTVKFDPPLRGTAATLMEAVTLTASVTGGVFLNCQGFQAF